MMRKLTTLAIILAFPSAGFSLGIRIVDQDAEATARGEAFTATADNPSAIYYNPAGITQLPGQNILLGTYGIYLQDKYTGFNGDSFRTKDQPQAVPQLYYTHEINNTPFTLGIGAYAPYGFGLEYPDDNPFRTVALKGSVEYFTLNPVLAWKINSTLSIAAGVTFNYAEAELSQGVLPFPGNSFRFKGTGYATGFNLGIMWQPAKEHSFGLRYQSGTDIGLNGHSTLAVPGRYFVDNSDAQFQFPEFITGGYSYRPNKDWNFEFDVDWANWHQLKTVTLNQQFLGSVPLNFNWESSLMYEFGATRYFSNGYRVSAGYIYSQSSVPSGNFSPLVPDSDRHILSAGVGWQNQTYSWDFAYQFAYGPPRTISNGTVADGQYRFISHAITLSFGYHF